MDCDSLPVVAAETVVVVGSVVVVVDVGCAENIS